MKSLPLVKEPNPILHAVAKPIEAITDEIRELVDDMRVTMVKENGVGLAAPQIGRSIRLFVAAHRSGIKAFINPEIYWTSITKKDDEEGCLSVPGVWGSVCRPHSIKIRYMDEFGVKHDEKVMGFYARILQHEYDHINGTLFVEHLKK